MPRFLRNIKLIHIFNFVLAVNQIPDYLCRKVFDELTRQMSNSFRLNRLEYALK